jgi:hypothetical protein
VEVVLGAGLLVGRFMPVVLAGVALQLSGTFLVLVLRPDVAFVDGNPLRLSVEGEYVVKNLVLLAATASLALHALGTRSGDANRSPAHQHQESRPRDPHPGGRMSIAPHRGLAATTDVGPTHAGNIRGGRKLQPVPPCRRRCRRGPATRTLPVSPYHPPDRGEPRLGLGGAEPGAWW